MNVTTVPRAMSLLVLFAAIIGAEGCRAIEGIFKAGVWVGIVIAVIVIGGVVALVSRMGGS